MSDPETFDPKKLWAKAKEFVDTPQVRGAAKFCERALQVAAHIGQANLTGPLAAAGAAMGVVNIVLGSEEQDTYEAVREAASLEDLVPCPQFFTGLFHTLWDHGFFEDSRRIPVANKHNLRVREVNGIKFAVVTDAIGLSRSYLGYYTRGQSLQAKAIMLRELYTTLDSDVVTLKSVNSPYGGGHQLKIFALKGYEDLVYAGTKDPKVFAENFKRARDAGMSQAFLLTGPPGGGKTSFCFLVARALGGKTLVLDQSVFIEESGELSNNLLTAVQLFSPAVVLFDDVDGIGSGSRLLTLIDVMRRENPQILLMSATNYPERILPSLRRPGRLGRRVEFPAPNLDARRDIIQAYSTKFHLNRDIRHLAVRMEHPLFTPDYIKDVCEKAAVYSDSELDTYLDELLEYLRSLGGA